MSVTTASTTIRQTGDRGNLRCRGVTILAFILFTSVFCTLASAYTYDGEITSVTISPSAIFGGDNITHSVTIQNTGDDGLNISLQVSGGGDSVQTAANIIVPVDQSVHVQVTTRAPAVDSGQITFTYRLYWNRTSPDAEILLDTETRSVYINQSAPSTGSFYLTSDPSGARIYLDGSYRGTTSMLLSGLTTGSHVIRFSQSGYNDYSTAATVYAGQIRAVSVTLIPVTPDPDETGSLSLASSPAGADVYIDGAYRGITPVTLSGLTTGSHTVIMSQSGYTDYSTTVTMYAGQTRTVSVTLIPSSPATAYTGSITVTSSPAGADVYVDGSLYRGITPVTFSGLTTGSHTIRISQSGYADYTTTATVYAGQTTKVTGSLTVISQVPATSQTTAAPATQVPQTTGSFDPSGLILFLIAGVLVVAGGYAGYLGIKRYTAEKQSSSADESIKILKMRYAQGELSDDDYIQMLENLKR
jgi:hypothetical protein